MRQTYFSVFFAIVTIYCLVFGVSGCSKSSQNTTKMTTIKSTKPLPSGFYLPSGYCFLYAGSVVSFKTTFPDSIPAGSTFLWKFGDSTTSSSENPDHIFAQTGSYVVTLIINNDAAHATSNTIQIVSILRSPYTLQMGGPRSWSGTTYSYIKEWGAIGPGTVTDSTFSVQVIDSGTITFLDNVKLRLGQIDTIDKYLVFTDCGDRTMTYYYSKDSLAYRDFYSGTIGHNGEQLYLHAP